MKNHNLTLVCFGGKKISKKEINKNLSNIEIKQIFGDDNLLKELLKNALCLVNPSKYEGFSLPNLEAMAIGCPIPTIGYPIATKGYPIAAKGCPLAAIAKGALYRL